MSVASDSEDDEIVADAPRKKRAVSPCGSAAVKTNAGNTNRPCVAVVCARSEPGSSCDQDGARSPAPRSQCEGTPPAPKTERHTVREFVVAPTFDLLPYHTTTTVTARAAKRRAGALGKGPRHFRFVDMHADTSDDSDDDDCPPRSDAADISFPKQPEPQVQFEHAPEDTVSDPSELQEPDRDEEGSHCLSSPRDGEETTTNLGSACDSQSGEFSTSRTAGERSACTWLRRADYERLTWREGWLNDNIVNAYAELINKRNATYFENQRRDSADKAGDPHATGSGEDTTRVSCPAAVRPRKRTPVRTRSSRLTNASDDASVLVEGGRRRTFVFGSFFYELLRSGGRYEFSKVQRWTRHKSWSSSTPACPVLQYGKILVPINVHETHWVLAAIDITYRRFVYMDSLQKEDTTGVIPTLRRWLLDELTDKYTADVVRLQEVASWKVVINPPYVGTQTDGGSCGMFVLAHADHLERCQVPAFTQEDIPALRNEAARCLRDGMLAVE